jgi:integral membrane protein (TIGR01906 family)
MNAGGESTEGETVLRKFWSNLLFTLACILIVGVLLVTSIEIYAFDPGFYEKEYNKLKQNEVIGISREELKDVTQNLLDYTSGKRPTLDMKADIRGEKREVFNEKEKSHMVDVRALYLAARDTRNISAAAAVLFIVFGLLIRKKGGVKALLKTYIWVCGVFLTVVAALGLYAALDFNSFWTSFHLLFFSNNLWILDPATDVLIMMVPGEFFMDLVLNIIVLFVSAFIASIVVSGVAIGIMRSRERRIAHDNK